MKWKSKRPILKTNKKLSARTIEDYDEPVDGENFEDYESFIPKDLDVVEDGLDEEVDPDIQKLLMGEVIEKKVSKKKKKSKVIKVSLSRPPSPETIQVIRVDVVSNFSVEEVEQQQPEDELEKNDEKHKRKNKELLLKCNKLSLTTRS